MDKSMPITVALKNGKIKQKITHLHKHVHYDHVQVVIFLFSGILCAISLLIMFSKCIISLCITESQKTSSHMW